jgi:fibrillarin-like rRNA methylase
LSNKRNQFDKERQNIKRFLAGDGRIVVEMERRDIRVSKDMEGLIERQEKRKEGKIEITPRQRLNEYLRSIEE